MRSLFLRIFFWLSAALILISLAVVVTAFGTGGLRLTVPLFARSFLGDEIYASGATALSIYESSGNVALATYFDELRRGNGTEAWLIRPDGEDVLGRPIPGSVVAFTKRANAVQLPLVEFRGFQLSAAVKIESSQGLMTVAFLRRINRQPRARVIIPEVGLRYLAGLAAAILFSYGLSRLIARPVEDLRQAMRRYSGGTATLALPDKLISRKDELGDLAREFTQMKDRIERLLDRQRQLIADISHELRSPLTRLAVAVEIALDSKEREPELLERIKREVSCLEGLIQRLLHLASLENQSTERNNHAVSLTGILSTVVENAAFEAEAGGRRVNYHRPAEDIVVSGDESLLASALENILRNAIRYTAQQTSVDVSVSFGPSGEVEINVRDHGPGVPSSLLPEIFRPFFRVGAAREREGGGVGLGLSIAQRSVMVCGGKLSARNHDEGGLVVKVRLKRWAQSQS